MNAGARPCLFFDRDGIVNVSPSAEEYYVLSAERLFVMPAFVDALRRATARGWPAVIVTNQKGISTGVLTVEGLEAIHARLRAVLAAAGLYVLDIYTCPHGGDHPDRKPNPGMLRRAAREHGLDLTRSWMIGDHPRDIQAGRAAECATTVFVGPGAAPAGADHHLLTMDDLPPLFDRLLPDCTPQPLEIPPP